MKNSTNQIVTLVPCKNELVSDLFCDLLTQVNFLLNTYSCFSLGSIGGKLGYRLQTNE